MERRSSSVSQRDDELTGKYGPAIYFSTNWPEGMKVLRDTVEIWGHPCGFRSRSFGEQLASLYVII